MMKICIADSQSKVRYGLRVLLEQQPGWTVVGEAVEAQEIIQQVERNRPDLLLLDWGFSRMSAPGLVERLREICPHLRIVSLSGRSENRGAALATGVDAFASKAEPPEKLLRLIHSLYKQDGDL